MWCAASKADYPAELARWVLDQPRTPAPLVYATTSPAELARIQETHGQQAASDAVEHCFARLAQLLQGAGVDRFIIAGGETSKPGHPGPRRQAFHIGRRSPPVCPGCGPSTPPVAGPPSPAISGSDDFFDKAQEYFHD